MQVVSVRSKSLIPAGCLSYIPEADLHLYFTHYLWMRQYLKELHLTNI